MAVVPARRARLNRARASRDPVIHGWSEGTNGCDYWIPALPRRASPARSAGMTGTNVCGVTRRRGPRCKMRSPAHAGAGMQGRLLRLSHMPRPCGVSIHRQDQPTALDRAVLHETLGQRALCERQRHRHARFENAGFHQAADAIERCVAVFNVDILHDHAVRGAPIFDRRGIEIDQPSAALEHAVGALVHLTALRVDDHILIRYGAGNSRTIERDDDMGAELMHVIAVAFAAGCRDHRAEMPRQLHAGPAHRAGRAVDQQTSARANVRAAKRAHGAYAFVNDGSRLGKRDVRGGGGNLPARPDDHLGAAAVLVVSGSERDPIANADIIHIRAESHDLPCSVPAWNLRKADGEVRLQQPGAELAITRADTRGADANQQLARSRTWVLDLR